MPRFQDDRHHLEISERHRRMPGWVRQPAIGNAPARTAHAKRRSSYGKLRIQIARDFSQTGPPQKGVASMKTAILTSGLILAVVGGCHQPAPQQNSTTPAATTEDDYLQRINRLPQKQRDAVFYRAIDDAGFDCQSVKGSEARKAVQGYPAWVAHCSDGRDWVVILEKNGIVQVATPAQLRGVQASPSKSAGAAGNEAGQ
jgi:hypothetical protein